MPPQYEIQAKQRIKKFLQDFKKIIIKAEKDGFNENDTKTLILETLVEALGYKKFFEISGEFEIKGKYADIAIKLDDKVKYFIEVKSIGSTLTEKDLFQILSYSASHNLSWMVLTTGRIWRCYHLSAGSPPDITLVFEVDFLNEDIDKSLECLYTLSKEGMWQNSLHSYWEIAKATSAVNIAKLLFSESIIKEIPKKLYQNTKQKVSTEAVVEVLRTQIIKGSIIDQINDTINALLKSMIKKPTEVKKDEQVETRDSGKS